ncbi:SUMO-activating enzyme subunit 1-like isoform X2 [Oscarella lobularis]|uniref:SUMO-activating enzyme subunit 1-like isoform X2 n=1 Tax=Oscarella lobularis TaxID=121494 RepID=UPI003313A3EA
MAAISSAEAAVYDRQIRLWGLDAQKRLRNSSVLLVGSRSLAAEVGKNVVLSGVRRLTIVGSDSKGEISRERTFLDSKNPGNEGKEDVPSHFVQNLRRLNPMVHVAADDGNVGDKDETFFQQYDVVCLTQSNKSTMLRVSKICRRNDVKFFGGATFGYFSFFLSDLGKRPHVFVEEEKTVEQMKLTGVTKKKSEDVKMVQKEFTSVSFESALGFKPKPGKSLKRVPKVYFYAHIWLQFREKFGRFPYADCDVEASEELHAIRTVAQKLVEEWGVDESFIPSHFYGKCGVELVPVSAIVGGILSQEIIKKCAA